MTSRSRVLDSQYSPNITIGDEYIKFGPKTYELSENDYNIIKRLADKYRKNWEDIVPDLIEYFDYKEEVYWKNKGNEWRNLIHKQPNLYNYVDNKMKLFNESDKIRQRDEYAELIMKKYPYFTFSQIQAEIEKLESAGREPRERYNAINNPSSRIYDDCDPNCPNPSDDGCCKKVENFAKSILKTFTHKSNTKKDKTDGGKTKSKNKKHYSRRCKKRKHKNSCKNHK